MIPQRQELTVMPPERTREGSDINWIDEGMETLCQRVTATGNGHSLGRATPVTHHSHGVQRAHHRYRRVPLDTGPEGGHHALEVRCRFMVYRNRNEDEENFFIGKAQRWVASGGRRLAARAT